MRHSLHLAVPVVQPRTVGESNSFEALNFKMGFQLSYMGTKKQTAPAVADVISSAQPGILLDAFAGMCAVGEAVGDRRQLWNNDVQVFASRVAQALFTSKDLAPAISETADMLFNNFQKNLSSLEQRFEEQLVEEGKAF